MTLDDWLQISESERRQLRDEWAAIDGTDEEYDSPVFTIVEEACERLAVEFQHVPEVLSVFPAPHPSHQLGPWIWVGTDMPPLDKVVALPDEFLTFPVVQEPLRMDMDWFREEWRQALRNARWDERQIEDWISAHDWVFKSVFFRHDPPKDFLPSEIQRLP